jgi:hypothetical protein
VLRVFFQMTKGNVGSLLVFDPSKLALEGNAKDSRLHSASSEAVVGLVTERGMGYANLCSYFSFAVPRN